MARKNCKETPHSEDPFWSFMIANVRIFVSVVTMAATFYNQTNVKRTIERNVIHAMVQSKVKVHKRLSRAAWYLRNSFLPTQITPVKGRTLCKLSLGITVLAQPQGVTSLAKPEKPY